MHPEVTIVTSKTAKDLKTITSSLEGAVAVELQVSSDRWKATATAIAKAVWPTLTSLHVVITDFDPTQEVGAPSLTAKATAELWAAFPSLKHLSLRGHALCRGITHDTVEVLDVDGFVFGAGVTPPGGSCPQLHTLRWRFVGDEHGVAIPPEDLNGLWAQSLPALHTLDLTGADIDGSIVDGSELLASALLAQLKVLGLPSGSAASWSTVLKATPQLQTLLVTDATLAGTDARVTVVEPPPEDDVGEEALDEDHWIGSVDDADLKKEKLLERPGQLKLLTVASHSLEVEGGTILGKVAAAHPELERLDLNNPHTSGWKAPALEAFGVALGHHGGLKALHLRKNRLEGSGHTLAALLERLPQLETLELSQTDLKEEDLALMLPVAGRCPRLRELQMGNLAESDIAAKAWETLSSATLEVLEVWTTSFSEEGWAQFFSNLGTRLPRLKALSVTGNRAFSSATMQRFRDAFIGHQHLASIELDMLPTTAAYVALGELLSHSPIVRLVLNEGNKAQVSDGEACDSDAISALQKGQSLAILAIDIDDEDTAKHTALAQALAAMPAMRELSGWHPDEKDLPTLKALADTLASSTTRIYKKIDAGMSNALLRRGAVEELWLKGGYGFETELEHRVPGLSATTSLRTLMVHGGEFKKEHVKLLLDILEKNTSLRGLHVRMAMKVAVAKDLSKRCAKLKHLETLTVGAVATPDEVSEIAAAVGKGSTLKVTVDARPLSDR